MTKLAQSEIVRLARLLERELAQRRALMKRVEALELKIRETRTFLRHLTESAAPSVYTSPAESRAALEPLCALCTRALSEHEGLRCPDAAPGSGRTFEFPEEGGTHEQHS